MNNIIQWSNVMATKNIAGYWTMGVNLEPTLLRGVVTNRVSLELFSVFQ